VNNFSGLTKKESAKLTEVLFSQAEEMFETRYNTTE